MEGEDPFGIGVTFSVRQHIREAVAEWVRWSMWGRTDVYAWVRTPPVPLSNFVSFAEWLKITYMSP